MRRAAWAAIVAGLVALVVWLRAGAGGREGVVAPPERSRDAASPDRARDAASSDRAGALALEPAPAAAGRDASVPSAPEAAAAPDGAPAPGLVVRVVDERGAPAHGAEVFLIDHGRVRPARERVVFEPLDAELEALGERRVADRDGRVRFASPRGGARVAARTADAFGLRELLAAEPGPVELALAADPVVRVRVHDGGGRPVAGVPVGLGSRAGDHVRAPTDAAGIAELRARGAAALRWGASVALALPLAERVPAAVDLASVPPEPIELALPDTGSLDVHLLDAHGEPWELGARVIVEVADGSARVDAPPVLQPLRFVDLPLEGGRGVLERVGLGLELRLIVRAPEHDDRREIVRGPTRPGERVAVRVTLDAPLPVLAGRVVDDARRPLAHAELRLELRRENGASGRTAVTAGDGRFRCALDADELGSDRALFLEARLADGAVLHGRIPSLRLQPVVTDVGERVLRPSPIAVAGTVREPDGTAVPGVPVRVFLDPHPDAPRSGTRVPNELRTDALGRFELRGTPEATSLAIEVEDRELALGSRRIVVLGEEDVELVVSRAGSLVVRVDTSPWPVLELERSGARVFETEMSHQGGGLRFQRLLPGTYALVAGYAWSDARRRVDGLVVRAGEETRDPRLDPLDLAGLLPRVALEVVDPDGAPVAEPVFLVAVGDAQLQRVSPRAHAGRWILPLALPQRIRVEAPGLRTLETVVDGDARLTLARGIPVRIELAGPPPELPPGWRFTGELALRRVARGEPGRSAREPAFALDGGGADVTVPGPGAYVFAFQVVPAGDQAGPTSFWNEPQPVLEVSDDGSRQLFVLAAPDATTRAEIAAFVAAER